MAENNELAYDYYLRSLELKKQTNDAWGITSAHINIGTALIRLGKHDEAKLHVDMAKEIAEPMRLKLILLYVYDTYFELYVTTGDFEKALENYQISIAYKDSVFSKRKTAEITELQTEFENEKKEKELELLKEKQKYQQFVKRILISGIVTLFLISGIILWVILLKRRKDRIINLKEKQIMQNDLENKEIKAKEMRKEIEYKTKQLTTHALHMMQKNEMLNDIINLSNELLKSPEAEVKPKIRKLKQQIKQSLKTENDWEIFKLHFEQVNNDYFCKWQK